MSRRSILALQPLISLVVLAAMLPIWANIVALDEIELEPDGVEVSCHST